MNWKPTKTRSTVVAAILSAVGLVWYLQLQSVSGQLLDRHDMRKDSLTELPVPFRAETELDAIGAWSQGVRETVEGATHLQILSVIDALTSCPVEGRLHCTTCGARASCDASGGARLRCEGLWRDRHIVSVSAPRYQSEEVTLEQLGSPPAGVIKIVQMHGLWSTELTILADAVSDLSTLKLYLFASDTLSQNNPIPRGEPTASRMVGELEVSQREGQAFARIVIDVSAPVWVSVTPKASSSILLRPGGKAIMDLRTSGRKISLAYVEDGSPASEVDLLCRVLGSNVAYDARSTDRLGRIVLPGSDRDLVSIELLRNTPALFVKPGASDDLQLAGANIMLIGPDSPEIVLLRQIGWVLTLVDRRSEQPIHSEVAAWMEFRVGPSQWERAFEAHSFSDDDGRVRVSTSVPADWDLERRLVVHVVGWGPVRIPINEEVTHALLDGASGGLVVKLDRAFGPCFATVSIGGDPLSGGWVAIGGVSGVQGAEFYLRTDAFGECGPFWIAGARADLYLAGNVDPVSSLTEEQATKSDRGWLFTVSVVNDLLCRVHVTGAPEQPPPIYAVNAQGMRYQLDEEADGSLSSSVPRGVYVIGPQEWVLNEAHRIDLGRYSSSHRLQGNDVSISWNSDWVLTSSVQGIVDATGVELDALWLVPVYCGLNESFSPDRSQFRKLLSGSGSYEFGIGEPNPTHLLLCTEVIGISTERSVVVKVLSPGESVSVDCVTLHLTAAEGRSWSQVPHMFVRIDHGAPDFGVSDEKRSRLVAPFSQGTRVIGPVPANQTQVFIGSSMHGDELYPTNSRPETYRIK